MHSEPVPARTAPLLLSLSVALMLGATIRPDLLTDAAGHADHGAAMLLCGAMTAGFVRGVGFVPRHVLWRWLFSRTTFTLCLAGLLLSLMR